MVAEIEMEYDRESDMSERGEALTQEEVQFAQLIEERESLERRHTREREAVENRLVENIERRSVEAGEGLIDGGENHPRPVDLQDMFAQLTALIDAKFDVLSDRLDSVEQGDRVVGGDRVREMGDRRKTMVVGGENVPYHAMPKSLRDPILTAKFNGQPKEDVDQFIRMYQQQTEMADPTFATARLLTCLGDIASHAFRQHFANSRPADVKLADAIKFLRERYRKPTYKQDQLRRVLDYSQRKSSEMYFALIEEQLALVGIDPESSNSDLQRLLIAIASKGLKVEVYNKMRQDSSRFKSSYSYTAFKADAIAIDNALFSVGRVDAGDNPRGRRAMHIQEESDGDEDDGEVSESSLASVVESCSDRERDELRAMLLKYDKKRKDKRGSADSSARQPAYKFPLDYKSDSICRYCKSNTHIAPLCDSLYKRKNNGNSMPPTLRESLEAQLKH